MAYTTTSIMTPTRGIGLLIKGLASTYSLGGPLVVEEQDDAHLRQFYAAGQMCRGGAIERSRGGTTVSS